jgi:hypothetical protein
MNLKELRRQRKNHNGCKGPIYPNAGLQRNSGSHKKEIADANDEANTKRRIRLR